MNFSTKPGPGVELLIKTNFLNNPRLPNTNHKGTELWTRELYKKEKVCQNTRLIDQIQPQTWPWRPTQITRGDFYVPEKSTVFIRVDLDAQQSTISGIDGRGEAPRCRAHDELHRRAGPTRLVVEIQHTMCRTRRDCSN